MLRLCLGVALTNLATPAVQLQPVCPHHRSVFNDSPPVVLVRRRLVEFCKYSRRLMCFWIPCVFSRVNFSYACVLDYFPSCFFWKISLCSPVDYFSLRISLVETKFMFRFFFPFAVVFVLSFGLYLKGVVRVFPRRT